MSPKSRIVAYEQRLEDQFRHDWETKRTIVRSSERAFEIAIGNQRATIKDRPSQGARQLVSDATVLEPLRFRDIWKRYNGIQDMDRWTYRPKN